MDWTDTNTQNACRYPKAGVIAGNPWGRKGRRNDIFAVRPDLIEQICSTLKRAGGTTDKMRLRTGGTSDIPERKNARGSKLGERQAVLMMVEMPVGFKKKAGDLRHHG